MSLLVHVDAYSGYMSGERPARFVLDERIHTIRSVEHRWREPGRELFTVRTEEGKRYVLCHHAESDSWTLDSEYDGRDLFARESIELVPVSPDQVRLAERQIAACEQCHPDDAEIPFDWVLQDVTGRSGMVDFVMATPARCPTCRQPVTEKTLIDRTDA